MTVYVLALILPQQASALLEPITKQCQKPRVSQDLETLAPLKLMICFNQYNDGNLVIPAPRFFNLLL